MSELMLGNWVDCKLGDVASIIRGVTFPASSKVHEPADGYVACLRTSHVQEKLLWDNIYYVPQSHVKRADQLVGKNDILMSMANSSNLVGKVCINETDRTACFGAFLSAIRSKEIDHRYVYYYLKSSEAQQALKASASQTVNIANISVGTLENLRFPLPPLAEQTRIAAKLDELLAQVDTLKARVDGIPALLKRFRQSVLAAAVSGRLTEEWRVQNCPTPPTAPSPNKYSLSKEELKKFADLHNLPHVWECASAAEVCGSVRDGTHDTPAYHLSGIPLVTSKNIGSGFVDTKEAKLISIEDHLEISKRSLVEHGDVLFSMIGTVGNCCVVREQDSEFSIKNVGLFKKNEPVILPRFLEFWLNSQVMWSWLEKNLKGSSQKFASLGTLRAMPVFLPSLQEQTEIVRRVEQLFAFADQLEAKVATAQTRIDRLTQSILAKAFRGELVPQDSNDEPASVLLERIKAQRAAAPKAKRGRKASA
ncbi:MAG: specificity determinant for hsdM and hsdR [Pseudomonas sp.]|nr:MAG: specificity determinant for hsdM and hsdR [Pseudomonas sp.]